MLFCLMYLPMYANIMSFYCALPRFLPSPVFGTESLPPLLGAGCNSYSLLDCVRLCLPDAEGGAAGALD